MLTRVAALVGVAVVVMVLNVVASVLYMVVYGHVINPGHPEEFYREHVAVAAPYCSIVVGMPLMYLAGLWVGGWRRRAGCGVDGVRAGLVVWGAYFVIDLCALLVAGMSVKIAVLFVVSFVTKLVAVWVGARRGRLRAG
jgi:hypothetical protein